MLERLNNFQTDKVRPKLQAIGFGELLDTTFSLYRAHLRSFLGMASGYFIAMLLGVFVMFLDDSASRMQKIIIWVPTLGVMLGICVLTVSGLVSLSAHVYLRGVVSISTAFRQGMPRFFSCFVSAFLFAGVAVFCAVFLAGSSEAFYKSLVDDVPRSHEKTLNVAVMVSVLGWFVTFWSFYVSIVLVEGTSMRAGWRRRRNLIWGKWWRIAATIQGIFLFAFAISFILRVTIWALLALTGAARADSIMEMLLIGVWNMPVRRQGLSSLKGLMGLICLGTDTFTMPIWVIGSTLLYFNQRIRKEGFDVEMMARAQGEKSG